MRFVNRIFLVVIGFALGGCENDAMGPNTGQGGSMARFTIRGDYLYVVDNRSINVFDIADGKFERAGEVLVGNNMETIFANGDFLYLGSTDGMYIYTLEDPAWPKFVFQYSHVVACDPVVVQGNRAYVTLRSTGQWCNRGVNRLDILDISDPHKPRELRKHSMSSPHGLGIDGRLLFICEGEHGLKVFDVAENGDIKLLKHIKALYAYDVIVRQGLATVTGKDGIFQFSYGDGDIALVGKIPVTRREL